MDWRSGEKIKSRVNNLFSLTSTNIFQIFHFNLIIIMIKFNGNFSLLNINFLSLQIGYHVYSTRHEQEDEGHNELGTRTISLHDFSKDRRKLKSSLKKKGKAERRARMKNWISSFRVLYHFPLSFRFHCEQTKRTDQFRISPSLSISSTCNNQFDPFWGKWNAPKWKERKSKNRNRYKITLLCFT